MIGTMIMPALCRDHANAEVGDGQLHCRSLGITTCSYCHSNTESAIVWSKDMIVRQNPGRPAGSSPSFHLGSKDLERSSYHRETRDETLQESEISELAAQGV